MNLFNLHFHKGAEHASADFSESAGAGGGHKCKAAATSAELQAPQAAGCGGLKPGDTIEVHWVFSSCAVKPGPGLASCVRPGEKCQLRVESQVFLLVNSASAASFGEFNYTGQAGASGRHQPKTLPSSSGTPVIYRGSTTNTAYNNADRCSPAEVSWSVRPTCAKLDINSLVAWCKGNVFNECEGHGSRALVTKTDQLSKID